MNKYTEFTPIVLLSSFTLKLLISQSWSFENAIVLVALASLSGLFHIKMKSDEAKEIRSLLVKQNEEIELLKKQDEYLKTSFASMKIASQVKPQAMRF